MTSYSSNTPNAQTSSYKSVLKHATNNRKREKVALETSKINFTDIKMVGKTNPRKNVYLSYEDSPKFWIQTPSMRIPYDIKGQSFDDTNPKYDLTLQFHNMNDKAKQKDREIQTNFHNNIKQIDELMINQVTNNSDISVSWLGKKSPSREIVEEIYTPMRKVHMDKTSGEPSGLYPDTIKVKLPCYDGEFKFDVFESIDDKTYEEVDQEDILKTLEKGSEVKVLMECSFVYFVNKGYGLSWKAKQISVKKAQDKFNGYCMVDSDDEEDDDTRNDTINVNTLVSDDDE